MTSEDGATVEAQDLVDQLTGLVFELITTVPMPV